MKFIKTIEALFYPRFAIEKKNDFYCRKLLQSKDSFFEERYFLTGMLLIGIMEM
ncbi:hypothetical protein BDE36_0614 [Arcticibacter tournemirensis]|nr:hypothetical protein BDE36_0614 [Arcticibacter tournemirensis]